MISLPLFFTTYLSYLTFNLFYYQIVFFGIIFILLFLFYINNLFFNQYFSLNVFVGEPRKKPWFWRRSTSRRKERYWRKYFKAFWKEIVHEFQDDEYVPNYIDIEKIKVEWGPNARSDYLKINKSKTNHDKIINRGGLRFYYKWNKQEGLWDEMGFWDRTGTWHSFLEYEHLHLYWSSKIDDGHTPKWKQWDDPAFRYIMNDSDLYKLTDIKDISNRINEWRRVDQTIDYLDDDDLDEEYKNELKEKGIEKMERHYSPPISWISLKKEDVEANRSLDPKVQRLERKGRRYLNYYKDQNGGVFGWEGYQNNSKIIPKFIKTKSGFITSWEWGYDKEPKIPENFIEYDYKPQWTADPDYPAPEGEIPLTFVDPKMIEEFGDPEDLEEYKEKMGIDSKEIYDNPKFYDEKTRNALIQKYQLPEDFEWGEDPLPNLALEYVPEKNAKFFSPDDYALLDNTQTMQDMDFELNKEAFRDEVALHGWRPLPYYLRWKREREAFDYKSQRVRIPLPHIGLRLFPLMSWDDVGYYKKPHNDKFNADYLYSFGHLFTDYGLDHTFFDKEPRYNPLTHDLLYWIKKEKKKNNFSYRKHFEISSSPLLNLLEVKYGFNRDLWKKNFFDDAITYNEGKILISSLNLPTEKIKMLYSHTINSYWFKRLEHCLIAEEVGTHLEENGSKVRRSSGKYWGYWESFRRFLFYPKKTIVETFEKIKAFYLPSPFLNLGELYFKDHMKERRMDFLHPKYRATDEQRTTDLERITQFTKFLQDRDSSLIKPFKNYYDNRKDILDSIHGLYNSDNPLAYLYNGKDSNNILHHWNFYPKELFWFPDPYFDKRPPVLDFKEYWKSQGGEWFNFNEAPFYQKLADNEKYRIFLEKQFNNDLFKKLNKNSVHGYFFRDMAQLEPYYDELIEHYNEWMRWDGVIRQYQRDLEKNKWHNLVQLRGRLKSSHDKKVAETFFPVNETLNLPIAKAMKSSICVPSKNIFFNWGLFWRDIPSFNRDNSSIIIPTKKLNILPKSNLNPKFAKFTFWWNTSLMQALESTMCISTQPLADFGPIYYFSFLFFFIEFVRHEIVWRFLGRFEFFTKTYYRFCEKKNLFWPSYTIFGLVYTMIFIIGTEFSYDFDVHLLHTSLENVIFEKQIRWKIPEYMGEYPNQFVFYKWVGDKWVPSNEQLKLIRKTGLPMSYWHNNHIEYKNTIFPHNKNSLKNKWLNKNIKKYHKLSHTGVFDPIIEKYSPMPNNMYNWATNNMWKLHKFNWYAVGMFDNFAFKRLWLKNSFFQGQYDTSGNFYLSGLYGKGSTNAHMYDFAANKNHYNYLDEKWLWNQEFDSLFYRRLFELNMSLFGKGFTKVALKHPKANIDDFINLFWVKIEPYEWYFNRHWIKATNPYVVRSSYSKILDLEYLLYKKVLKAPSEYFLFWKKKDRVLKSKKAAQMLDNLMEQINEFAGEWKYIGGNNSSDIVISETEYDLDNPDDQETLEYYEEDMDVDECDTFDHFDWDYGTGRYFYKPNNVHLNKLTSKGVVGNWSPHSFMIWIHLVTLGEPQRRSLRNKGLYPWEPRWQIDFQRDPLQPFFPTILETIYMSPHIHRYKPFIPADKLMQLLLIRRLPFRRQAFTKYHLYQGPPFQRIYSFQKKKRRFFKFEDHDYGHVRFKVGNTFLGLTK